KIEHFAAVHLGGGAFDGVFLQDLHQVHRFIACPSRDHGLDVACAAVDHRLNGKNLDGHFGQFFAHESEIADGLAERFAFAGVFGGGQEHVLGAADAAGAKGKAPSIEDVEGNDVATADFVQQVFLGNFAVFEEHGGGGAAVDTHLVFFVAGL